MLTPQELQEKKFAKAVFGGYDMGEVDEFLDQMTNDYEQLYKENAILKGKLKALAEKVEEYRSVDEQMRATLARAKRESDEQIAEAAKQADDTRREADEYAATVRADADSYSERLLADARNQSAELMDRAKHSADEMVTTARNEAMQKLTGLRTEIEQEAGRLAAARAETKKYAAEVAEVCKRQLEALRTIVAVPQQTDEQPAVAAFAPQQPAVEQPAAPVETAPRTFDIDEPTKKIDTERITERLAAEDPADAAQAADNNDDSSKLIDFDAEPTRRLDPVDDQPTIRFDAVRRVDMGGNTVEFGDADDEQSDDDAFMKIFGKDEDHK